MPITKLEDVQLESLLTAVEDTFRYGPPACRSTQMEKTAQPRLRNPSSPRLQIEITTMPLIEPLASSNPQLKPPAAASTSPEVGLSFNDQYKRELEEYRTIFNLNMMNKPVKHDRVFVLMWTWGDGIDDMGVKDEVSSCI
jgi:hypothetical protein